MAQPRESLSMPYTTGTQQSEEEPPEASLFLPLTSQKPPLWLKLQRGTGVV